ncbi:MAG: AAA family ATPase [Parvularculaceae bacterium]
MFEERFSFSGSPFRLAPDPKVFFGSKSHNKAMSYLHYGLRQAEGFIVITGEIGAGKSVLIGHLLDQLDRSNVIAANLLTPNLPASDLLPHILSAFRIEPAGEGKAAGIEAFEDFLFDHLNHGRRVLLVIDEAQNLPLMTLEELRVLSNMEYDGTPLFQVFLVGQPDFRETMARPDMEQLRQRVIATYHLEPMTREETEGYIKHRLAFVGWTGEPSISSAAFDAIFAATGGVPRKIHKLCNRAFLFAAVEDRASVDACVIESVLADLIAEQAMQPSREAAEELRPLAAAPPPKVERAAGKEKGAIMTESKAALPELPATVLPPVVQLPVTPPSAAVAFAGSSVFDRLASERKIAKSARKRVAVDEAASPPKSATLDEVATAIAAARIVQRDHQSAEIRARAIDAVEASEPATLEVNSGQTTVTGSSRAVYSGPVTEISDDQGGADYAGDDIAGADDHPSFASDPGAWKASVVASINDTRDELKRAHHSVTRLRRQMTEIASRRHRRRDQIEASLVRAETLLADIRNAWR